MEKFISYSIDAMKLITDEATGEETYITVPPDSAEEFVLYGHYIANEPVNDSSNKVLDSVQYCTPIFASNDKEEVEEMYYRITGEAYSKQAA